MQTSQNTKFMFLSVTVGLLAVVFVKALKIKIAIEKKWTEFD